jgi:hypothetical protein
MEYTKVDDDNVYNNLNDYMALCSSLVEPEVDKYGLEWGINSTNDGLDYRCVKFNNQNYHFELFTEGFYRTCREVYCKMIKFNSKYQLKIFPHDSIFDDRTNRIPGYSFLSDKRNHDLIGEQSKYKRAILARFGMKNGNSNSIESVKMKKMMKLASQICESLIFLIHFSSGGPARGTEHSTFIVENTMHGSIRSVFWSYNTICIVQSYNKNQAAKLAAVKIPRFLPYVLTQLVLWYLVYIRPVTQ